MSSLRSRLIVLCLALTAAAALGARGFQAASRSQLPAPSDGMAALLPPGALLTIESPDFAALLHDWNASPEQRAWLSSDDHSVFLNSRLFGRLNDARAEFEGAAATRKADAKPAFDGDFLAAIAGRRSIFAWYDIGNLEFVYVTHLPRGQAGRTALLQSRGTFTPRRIAGYTFYMRRGAGSEQGRARTVAFAEINRAGDDLLVLATREDLIAGTLRLLASPTRVPSPASLAAEPWYTDAAAALVPEKAALAPEKSAPALHMTLNLDRIVATPYFRSYWIQGNVSEMKQYRAAAADLYREPSRFREERILLLKNPGAADLNSNAQPSLDVLAAIAPDGGVFRARRTEDPAVAIAAIQDKLLGRSTREPMPSAEAPDPTLTPTESGSSADLETFIDTPDTPAPAGSTDTSTAGLARALMDAGLNAVLTYASALPPATPNGLWIPIHSAVVLRGAAAWNPRTLEAALQESLRGTLTASNIGIEFRPENVAGHTLYALAGPKPLLFAVLSTPALGNLYLLSDNRALLLQLLQAPSAPAEPDAAAVSYLAGFDHASQRAPYTRLTGLIDGTNEPRSTRTPSREGNPPAFFSSNLRSLSDSFAALTSERITERRDGALVRQTVLYQWQREGQIPPAQRAVTAPSPK